MGALLGSIDTALTYATGHAPFGDVVLITAIPLITVSALAILTLFISQLVGRSELAPPAVEATLLIAPVLLFGARGCVTDCFASAGYLLLRWLPTVSLVALLAVIVARGSQRWSPLPSLIGVALTTQLSAAMAFGVRTDEFLGFNTELVVLCVALMFAVAIGWRACRLRWASSAQRIALFLIAAATATAWVLRTVPPHLPSGASVPPLPGQPNVLMVVLDTVRADHLSLYGYRRRTSPNLEKLAADSLVFDRARANATYSLASHASLFTGLLPSRHGARPIPNTWLQTDRTRNASSRHFRVRNDAPILAEDLKALGYYTAGISGNHVFLARWTGLQRGFNAFFEATVRRQYRFFPLSAPVFGRLQPRFGVSKGLYFQDTWRAPDITDAAIDWLRAAPAPFFLFLNYFDPHSPYDPPGGGPFQRDGVGLDGEVAAYDGEIAAVDAHLGRLFQFMRDRGLLERTLVIVTADHGEYFGEHGLRGHQPLLYEPVLNVPLIVHFPGVGPTGHVVRWTGLHEIRGLVREVLGGQRPLSILERRDAPVALAEAWTQAAQGEALHADPSSVAIYFGDFKLLANRSGPGALFNLTTDPGENHDLLRSPSPTTSAIEARMRQALTLDTTIRMGEAPEAPTDALERLRALGYIQ